MPPTIQLAYNDDNKEMLQYELGEIMERFEWKQVAEAMRLLKIRWYNPDTKRKAVPGVRKIKETMKRVLLSLIENPHPVAYFEGYGFLVTKVRSELKLRFVPYGSGLFDRLYQDVTDQYRINDLHPLMQSLRSEMVKVWWIGELSYPANSAMREGLGDNYLALSGDGLLCLLFEVMSLEGDGLLRYHNLYHDNPRGENGYPSGFGLWIHQKGVKHNDTLTFPQAIQHVREFVGQVNSRGPNRHRAASIAGLDSNEEKGEVDTSAQADTSTG